MRVSLHLAPLRRSLAAAAAAAGLWAKRQRAFRAGSAVCGRLLDEAGDLLAPLMSRVVPDARLVAVPRRDGGVDLHRVTGRQVVPLSSTEPVDRPGRVELRLRADQVLERSLTLPAASRDYLGTIVEHRLDRLTPWRREAVRHGFAITGTSDDGATLTVRVLLASAETVDAACAALQSRGLAPTTIGGLADRPAEPLPIVLGHGTTPPPRPAWLVSGARLWLAATAGLAVLAIGMTLWASAAADRQAEAERHLGKARRLIRNATGGPLDAGDPAMAAAKRPDGATVVLIDKLSAALPDSAYLREMTLTPSDVRLAGTASDAPALIPALEQAGFVNVRFTAPVARGADHRDSFEITADRAAPKEDAP